MNQSISEFARKEIQAGLDQLPEENQRMFKLMYGRSGGRRSVEDAERMSISDVVSELPEEKLDMALSQVERTVAKARGVQ